MQGYGFALKRVKMLRICTLRLSLRSFLAMTKSQSVCHCVVANGALAECGNL
ncbi:hypothetical protein [Helicobacter sp.]|uniref:hypothetical protein n=1 Tax=Helicobacter sp. TaxID=218 RepID=UPI0025BDF750|nr:hypothetical protein [Helicobacter sp.]MCI5633551.1 hypothetical protein [Helicobacter sp.]